MSRKINILPRVGNEHVFLCIPEIQSVPGPKKKRDPHNSSEGLTGFDWVRLISLTKRNAISLQRNEAMAYAAWRYLNKDQRRGMLLIVGCDHVTCRLVNLVWIPQGN